MGWELKSAREHFAACAAEWDRLNAELHGCHPFFDSRFVGPLLEHFGTGDERLCIHRSAGTPDGALILHPRGLGRWETFTPDQAQVSAVLVGNGQLFETLFPALPARAWSIDLLALDPDYAPDWRGLRLPRRAAPHALTMAAASDGAFADYWQTRPKNLRKNIRRYRRRAEETLGPLRLTACTDPDGMAQAVARYGGMESAGWKGRRGTAIAADNVQGRFYADLLARFARAGRALVLELRAGERLVASRLLIRNETMWIILKTTYDEAMAAIAPGRLLLQATLEHAMDTLPGAVVEFYTNASRDQAEWATALRPISHHQILRNPLVAGLYALARPRRAAGKAGP